MKSQSTYLIIFTWALLFIYFISSFRSVQPYLEYNLNYEYISNVLCINKANDQLKCNGKCHLVKELKKAVEAESQKKETSTKTSVEVIPANETILNFKNIPILISNLRYPSFSEDIQSLNPENSTPPPRC